MSSKNGNLPNRQRVIHAQFFLADTENGGQDVSDDVGPINHDHLFTCPHFGVISE